MELETLIYEKEDRIATLTLNRPHKGNALSRQLRDELDLVLERLPEARIIGINNRDLATFATSLEVTLRLAKRIPGDKLIVSESGIGTRDLVTVLHIGFEVTL